LGISRLTARPILAVVPRYGLAVSSVAVALGTALIQRHYDSLPRFISLEVNATFREHNEEFSEPVICVFQTDKPQMRKLRRVSFHGRLLPGCPLIAD
jgi:hypothetical protein